MKITSIQAIPASVVTNPSKGISRTFIFVKVETDEGIVGWGEATSGPLAVISMIEEFGKVLIGKDPMEIEKHWQTLYHYFHVRGGVV